MQPYLCFQGTCQPVRSCPSRPSLCRPSAAAVPPVVSIRTSPALTLRTAARKLIPHAASFYNNEYGYNDRRPDSTAASHPAARNVLLSSAIASCSSWQQLAEIVERCSQHLTVNHISHILTRIEQLLSGQQISPADAAQVSPGGAISGRGCNC